MIKQRFKMLNLKKKKERKKEKEKKVVAWLFFFFFFFSFPLVTKIVQVLLFSLEDQEQIKKITRNHTEKKNAAN